MTFFGVFLATLLAHGAVIAAIKLVRVVANAFLQRKLSKLRAGKPGHVVGHAAPPWVREGKRRR